MAYQVVNYIDEKGRDWTINVIENVQYFKEGIDYWTEVRAISRDPEQPTLPLTFHALFIPSSNPDAMWQEVRTELNQTEPKVDVLLDKPWLRKGFRW